MEGKPCWAVPETQQLGSWDKDSPRQWPSPAILEWPRVLFLACVVNSDLQKQSQGLPDLHASVTSAVKKQQAG